MKAILLLTSAVFSVLLFADKTLSSKVPKETPSIKAVAVLPPEEISGGPCEASTSGYLGVGDRTELTEAEIGQYITTALRGGFVLTIYPPTKRGVFVNASCAKR